MRVEQLVKIKLTGEIGMLLISLDEVNDGYQNGYWVRLPNYDVVKFYDFELSEISND